MWVICSASAWEKSYLKNSFQYIQNIYTVGVYPG
jgi:hypothetical protein